MSVLVAIKTKDRIVVGVDSRMTGCDQYIDSYSSRPKAYHLDSMANVIVGGVGNIGLVDILKDIMSSHVNNIKDIDRGYIVKYILPELIAYVKDYDMRAKDGYMDGELFVAIDDRAYTITGNYIVEEVNTYIAKGSGAPSAIGSLYTTTGMSISPEERIKIAIEAAGYCTNTVSRVAYIGDTKGRPFNILDTTTSKKRKTI